MTRETRETVTVILAAVLFGGLALFAVGSMAQPAQPVGCDDVKPNPFAPPLVYTRQPRATTPHSDIHGSVDEGANWQHYIDIAKVDGPMGETDLVFDNRRGAIRVIHDCTTSAEVCAAHQARVAPNGFQIAYVVSRGDSLAMVKAWGGPWLKDVFEFHAKTSEIWIYNVVNGKSVQVSSGHQDKEPDWINNTRLVFASDRHGTYPPLAYADVPKGGAYPHRSQHLFVADLTKDLKLANFKNYTPEAAHVMAPMVATNGDILYSRWEGFGDRGREHTPNNMWWIEAVHQDGTNNRSILGAHGSGYIKTSEFLADWVDPARKGEGHTIIKGLRPPVELRPNYFATVNYYRGNSTGAMGIILGWEGTGLQEGVSKLDSYIYRSANNAAKGSGRFIPPTLLALTPYGTDTDASFPRFSKAGVSAGRAGYPAPSIQYEYIFTHAQGWCYEAPKMAQVTKAYMGGPTCKKEIRGAKVLQVTNPFDPKQSEVIACPEDQWHCFDAQEVTTYGQRFGQPEPTQQVSKLAGDTCELNIVNLKAAELNAFLGATAQDRVSFQGNAAPNYAEVVDRFRVEKLTQWSERPLGQGYKAAEVISLTRPEADGSLRVPVPCETPIRMTAIDAAGNIVATDNVAHSLRTGERRACHGCHDGHSTERGAQLPDDAAHRFSTTIAGSKP